MSEFLGITSRPEDGYLGVTEDEEGKGQMGPWDFHTKSQFGECSALELSWDISLPKCNKTKKPIFRTNSI